RHPGSARRGATAGIRRSAAKSATNHSATAAPFQARSSSAVLGMGGTILPAKRAHKLHRRVEGRTKGSAAVSNAKRRRYAPNPLLAPRCLPRYIPPMSAPAPSLLPLVGVPCCTRIVNDHQTHWVSEKYVIAVSAGAGAVPLMIPALGDEIDVADLVTRLDGLLVTGSRSNVEPQHYAGEASAPGTAHDPQRDAQTLPLI